MGNNPARTAWTILLIFFILFCLLAISVPLAVRYFAIHAVKARPAVLQVATGTVLLITDEMEEPIAVVDTRGVEEGTLIRTDQSSQGTLSFPAGAETAGPQLATVQIYTNAAVKLLQSTTPRFNVSDESSRIVLGVEGGRVRINTSELLPRGLHAEVRTPHSTIVLQPGSYAVDVTNQQTQVATRFGSAVVTAESQAVIVTDGMSTQVAADLPPAEPSTTAENLIANGDFQEPLESSWLVTRYPEDDPSAGAVEQTTTGDRASVNFRRINQPPTHTEVGITQVLNHSVHDFSSLNLGMDVLLRWQSLLGAGEQSSEFPLMFWLDYEDVYGVHQFWTHGFYYRDPPNQWQVVRGEKIPEEIWFPFESGNLFERLPAEGLPRPAKINYIKIYASGHNFDSQVSEVRLIAR